MSTHNLDYKAVSGIHFTLNYRSGIIIRGKRRFVILLGCALCCDLDGCARLDCESSVNCHNVIKMSYVITVSVVHLDALEHNHVGRRADLELRSGRFCIQHVSVKQLVCVRILIGRKRCSVVGLACASRSHFNSSLGNRESAVNQNYSIKFSNIIAVCIDNSDCTCHNFTV